MVSSEAPLDTFLTLGDVLFVHCGSGQQFLGNLFYGFLQFEVHKNALCLAFVLNNLPLK